MLLAPSLARIALNFGPPEFFALIVFGLIMVSYLGSGSMLKALVMAVLGLFVSTVGLDSLTGFERFTFSTHLLTDGVGLVPVAIGMFGIAEVLTNLEESGAHGARPTTVGRIYPRLAELLQCRWAILRGTVLGFFMGILPGAGTVLPPFFSYLAEKRVSKTPELFGQGALEGVAGPETANNAATSGVMVPLLALGIPPNLAMAMLLGGFIVHGIQPGPFFVTQHPDLFWTLIAALFIGNAVLLVLNLPLVRLWVKILEVPYSILFPLIIVFCLIGVYGESNNVHELHLMLGFGVLGYLLRKARYPLAPFLLALVLGPILETNFRQSLLIAFGSPMIFVERPIAAALLGVVAILVVRAIILAARPAAGRPATAIGVIEGQEVERSEG
jgi:putative tricarboxylic transport membrane protein